MANTTVHFMLFEKANFLGIEALLSYMANNSSLRPVYVKGFDYKEFTGQIKPLTLSAQYDMDTLGNYAESMRYPLSEMTVERLPNTSSDPQSEFVAALFSSCLKRDYIPTLTQKYHMYAHALKQYCEIHAPRLIVLPEDTDYIRGRMASRILRQFRCKIVIMYANYYNYFVKYPLVGERFGDIYLTTTRQMRNRLIAANVDRNKVIYCGSPALDELRELRRDKVDNCLMFVLQNTPDEVPLLSDVIQLIQQYFPKLSLIVKPHPECKLPKQINQQNGIQIADRSETIQSLLKRVGAVIGQSSTVIYQAIATNVPVIIPNYSGLPLQIDLPEDISSQSVVEGRSAMIHLITLIFSGHYTTDQTDWLVPDVPAIPKITATLESLKSA